jgi:Transglutaminase-like superfamily
MIEPVALAMTRLGRFLRLSPADRRLLVTAALLLAAIRLGLTLLPYRRLRKLVDRLARVAPRRQPAPPASAERIAWAVTQASRSVPAATCLTQALAARVLLERRGHPARVRVGIGRAEGTPLLAHAWVESEKGVVIGGGDLSHYVPLASWEGLPRGEGLRGR